MSARERGDPASERGLMWDAFGLSCPASPSHIPVPAHLGWDGRAAGISASPQGPSKFWNPSQAQMCFSLSSLCPWWGEKCWAQAKQQKKHIFHSTPVGFNCKDAGGAGLGVSQSPEA